ncbi:anti-sigma factor [Nocardioides antri]|uniref:anti-sigma factor n=1 Tax=Nocardioides antri TaxID=2607659 RepID=UPI00165F88CB|nr:anti-sigma factor [Nocardioides antri]
MRPPKWHPARRAPGVVPGDDGHALSGAYVLDAVKPLERRRFEAHLAECASCRLEVAGLRETAAELSQTVATDPPSDLKPRVLGASGRLAQGRTTLGRPQQWSPSRSTRLLVAAAAVLAIGGSSYALGQQHENPSPVTAEAVFEAPDARVRGVALEDGEFRIALSPKLGLVAVQADMPPLPAGRTYQAWVIADEARSLGVLEDGEGFVPIPSDGRLAVTVEPEGGSIQPTTVPLFALPLENV